MDSLVANDDITWNVYLFALASDKVLPKTPETNDKLSYIS